MFFMKTGHEFNCCVFISLECILLHEEMSNGVGPQVLPTLVTALPLRIVTAVICTYMVMATYVKICFQGALIGMKFY